MKVISGAGFVCPYCNTESDYEATAVPDGGGRLDCGGCFKTFIAWAEREKVFYTRDLEGGQLLLDTVAAKEVKVDEQ